MLLLSSLAWMLPTLSLGITSEHTINERFLYFPSTLFCVWMILQIRALALRRVGLVALVLVCGCAWGFGAYQSAQRWHYAGLRADNILKMFIVDNVPQHAVLLGIPDNQAGALMFRNGFKEAISLHGAEASVAIPMMIADWTGDDHFQVTQSGDTLQMQSTEPWARWMFPGTHGEYWSVSENGDVLKVVLSKAPGPCWILQGQRFVAIR